MDLRKRKTMDIYRKKDDVIIFGTSIPVFIYNGGVYHLISLGVYQDGMIDCWGMVSIDEFQEKVKSGWVRTKVKEGSAISVFPLGILNKGSFEHTINEDELVKEIKDIIEELNNRPTTSVLCREVFDRYLENPNEENKAKLKEAYENIPEHNRVFLLGDMDVDDIPIRIVLYGEQSIVNKIKLNFSRKKIDNYLKYDK